jgi:hypothetical protein
LIHRCHSQTPSHAGATSGQDRQKLQLALLTSAAGGDADYTAFALANPSSIANMEALDGVANPPIFLDRMRPMIEGRKGAAR